MHPSGGLHDCVPSADQVQERQARAVGFNRDMDATNEVEELRRCTSDIAHVLELAATWKGRDPTRVAESLLDTLLGMLALDFVYLRLNEAAHSFERVSRAFQTRTTSSLVSNSVAPWLGSDPENWPTEITIGGVALPITVLRLGISAGIGLLVAGSRREGFPKHTDHLRLSVAASQATIALREMRQLSDRELPRDRSHRDLIKETLAESERRLRHFIDTIPVSTWCTTADGMAELFNQYHVDYVGRTREELVGLGYLAQFHPDDLPIMLPQWQDMLGSKRGGELEGRTRRADGEYRWTLIRTSPLLDGEGNVMRWYGVNFDIEDRKRAEDSLRAAEAALTASERNLKLIIDSLPVLVWSSRTDGSADFVNDRYLEYVGLPAERVLGWEYLNVWHPEDKEPVLARWQAQLDADVATNVVRIRRYDQTYRWFYLSGQKFKDANGNVRWFGVALDIEDLKHAEDALRASEAALRESERRLRQIIGTIPALAWSANPEGEATFLNQHFLDYTGLTLEGALGGGWIGAVDPKDLQGLTSAWRSMRMSGKGGDFEARLRRADGHYRWFLFRTNPLFDDAGNLVQWFGINTDIEDRKHAEEELRESQAELAHVSRMMTMGELAVSIAHEVNQPLMAIVTNAGTCLRWLDEKQLDVEQARKAAERIGRDGQRAGEIIAGIRALARKSLPTFEPMVLEHAIQDVFDLMRGEFRRIGIQPTLDSPETMTEVLGDRTQLRQVVLNLIMNSTEAMAGTPHRRHRLAIRTAAGPDGFATVSVSDTGPGLNSNTVDQLFDAFFTTKPGGIGMGLSICRSIIEAHGGQIWAAPNTPEGTAFSFTVPLAASGGADQQGARA